MPRQITLTQAALLLSLLLTAANLFAADSQYRLAVDGLACPFCAYGIEKQIYTLEGVAQVETNIKDGVVIVTMQDGATLDKATAQRAVKDAGFTLRGFSQVPTETPVED